MSQSFDMHMLLQDAQTRWLKPSEVHHILVNHDKFEIGPEPPNKPHSGTLFLFNRRVNRYWRKDGHSWRCRKDGKTVCEAHELLKVGNVDALRCYYAHGYSDPCFQRRSYWMLDPAYEHIVLVHYRDVREHSVTKLSLTNLTEESSSTVDFPFRTNKKKRGVPSAEAPTLCQTQYYSSNSSAGVLAESSRSICRSSAEVSRSAEDELLVSDCITSITSESYENASICRMNPKLYGDTTNENSFGESLNAAICIQSAFRAFICRKRRQKIANFQDEYGPRRANVDELKTESRLQDHYNVASKAAALIQKRFRGWKQHKRFLNALKCVVKIQAHVRGHQVRKYYITYGSAAAAAELGKTTGSWFTKGTGLRGFCMPETSREDGHSEYSELTKKFKRQKIDKDAWRIFSNEDYSDTRNQDSDSLARVEQQHYTLCKDVNAWLALVKQCQKGGLYHTCMQQAPPQLLGRDDIKQRIAEKMLGSNESNCTVICIVAGSGLGKTSLLHVLHNDQQLLDAFDKRICIQMSDKFDKLMLFRNIIEYAMREHCSITNLSFLEEMVKEELADKKFLLFLDDADIEDQHFWTSALEILNAGVKGSAVVIATRSTTVADFTAGALHSYYLDPLSEESNLMLLQQYACMGQDIHSNPDLVAIAKRFIARFGANPLKLKALGVYLFHSDIIPLDEGRFEGDTVPCLQLCHDSLPIYLKQCLAFCSLFPKGYIFDKHHMVLLWLSRGFIVPAEGRELEDIGVGYFHELLCRSLFQYSPFHNEKDNKFVMHELIYNMVVSISHDKYFKSEDPLSHIPENICHLSLVSSQFQTVQLASRTEELKDLQTFLIVQPEWQQRKISFPTLNIVCLNDLFLKFRSLETLDLSYTDIEELPSSIVGLRNLRYLSLNNTSIRALPSELCSLSNLQTLEAKDCHFLTELPEDTRRLLKLRHLNVGKNLGYVRMPRGVGQLTELRTVPVFHVGGGLPHCSINELGNLYNLRGCLLVAGLENVRNGSETLEANLNYKQHLQDLTLQWHDGSVDIDDDNEEAAENVAEQVLESLQPHANLQELAIRRYQGNEFPSWIQGSSSLPSLVSLTLDSCCNCSRFPAIAQLPSLKFLSVRKMYEVQQLSSDTQGAIKFPSLELLNLWEMYGLEELFEVSEGDCPRLRKICISRCPFLKRLPCIPSVVDLVLHCCHQLPDIPELASLASLKIEGFHGVRSLSLPPQLPALRKLDIRGCNELSSVHGLSVLTAVERLKIAGCPKLDLSKN